MPLVLTRKAGEAVYIGRDITVSVSSLDRGSVKLAIEAPDHVDIARKELVGAPPPRTDMERLKERCDRLWRERNDLAKSNKRMSERLKGLTPATDDEVRAAFKLGVSVSQLRTWAKQERGPQPPYRDVDAWQGWVEAQMNR